MTSPGRLPLEDVTVVALEQAVAAPYTTRQLADLGPASSRSSGPTEATSPAATTTPCGVDRARSSGSTAARNQCSWT